MEKRLSYNTVFMLILGFASIIAVGYANTIPNNNNNNKIYNDNNDNNNNNNNNNNNINTNNNNESGEIEISNGNKNNIDDKYDIQISVNDHEQIKLLSKQLDALMERRQEDYKLLENSLLSDIRKNSDSYLDVDVKRELKDLRDELKKLREGVSPKKEILTEWLSSSIKELRSEVSEIQQTASDLSKKFSQKNFLTEDIENMHEEMKTFKLEMNAMKSRQDKSEVLLRELREEVTQSSEDYRKSFLKQHSQKDHYNTIDFVEPEADHKLRHYRMLRQQVHDLEISQRAMKRSINEMQHQRLPDRISNMEIEQKKLANSNFNMSRQISNFDKLHSSMLELLEDIEDIQTKFDKTVPEIRREITKVEIDSAQLTSDQHLLKEEDHNLAKTVQAMAYSISTLQTERTNRKTLEIEVHNLKVDIKKLQAAAAVHKNIAHNHINKIEMEAKHLPAGELSTTGNNKIDSTFKLLEDLENVEMEFENIVRTMPNDCSDINPTSNGLNLIAPNGQKKPTMVKCMGQWTVIQSRIDGTVDFNRSWEDYSRGFGNPNGEFWVGNEMLHHLTSDNCTKLRIVMQDIYDKTWHVEYDEFRIGSRHDGYRLDLGGYSGNASNALDYQNHMQFSSIDVDRDISNSHCAGNYEGGWWFSHCQHANLNGRYNLGLTWFDSQRNEWIAVKSSIMMLSKRTECLNNEDLNNTQQQSTEQAEQLTQQQHSQESTTRTSI